jgi:hypothetical protein
MDLTELRRMSAMGTKADAQPKVCNGWKTDICFSCESADVFNVNQAESPGAIGVLYLRKSVRRTAAVPV